MSLYTHGYAKILRAQLGINLEPAWNSLGASLEPVRNRPGTSLEPAWNRPGTGFFHLEPMFLDIGFKVWVPAELFLFKILITGKLSPVPFWPTSAPALGVPPPTPHIPPLLEFYPGDVTTSCAR